MRIDLHTHSNRSDGTDSPSELVANAVAAGLDVIAITDHDSTAGWDEATEETAGTSLRLVHGIEISTLLDYRSIHLLGYEFDPTNVPLLAELDRILGGRDGRLPLILKALQSHGVAITEADVLRWSDNAAATGRPHVADALVELGVVKDRTEAFDVWLKPGRPAYIDRYAADLFDAIALLKAAGGVAVIAHPWSRGSDQVMTEEVFAKLKDAGLSGMEVDHNDHPPAAREALRGIARNLDLVVTGSSDYHGTGKIDFDLGCNTTDPDAFARLLPSFG